MGIKERGKRKCCTGSNEEKEKRRGTWEGIKHWVCVLYCENALLATI